MFILFVSFVAVFIMAFHYASASVVCGYVENCQTREGINISSSWMYSTIYYEEDPNERINCQITSENKYCCSLEDIESVNWEVGKNVITYVHDDYSGCVGGPVNLTTSPEGYTLFPDISLQKAIDFSVPNKITMEPLLKIDVKLRPNYNNLEYEIINENSQKNETVCDSCLETTLKTNLTSGKNKIILRSHGEDTVEENFSIYLLDYLHINREIACEECHIEDNETIVPQETTVDVKLNFNSSHAVKGVLKEYFPVDWNLIDKGGGYFTNSTDYENYNLIKWEINNKTESKTYSLKSPSVSIDRSRGILDNLRNMFSKEYYFHSYFEGEEKESLSLVYRILIPSGGRSSGGSSRVRKEEQEVKTFSIVDNKNPLIIRPESGKIDLAAVYTINKEKLSGYINQINDEEYEILVDIDDSKIDRVLISFKIEKGKEVDLYENGERVEIHEYKQEGDYIYYQANISGRKFSLVEKLEEGPVIKDERSNIIPITGKITGNIIEDIVGNEKLIVQATIVLIVIASFILLFVNKKRLIGFLK